MVNTKSKVPNEKGVWYYISYWECPLCGRVEEYRERMPAPRPEAWGDRHEYNPTSGCGSHFL